MQCGAFLGVGSFARHCGGRDNGGHKSARLCSCVAPSPLREPGAGVGDGSANHSVLRVRAPASSPAEASLSDLQPGARAAGFSHRPPLVPPLGPALSLPASLWGTPSERISRSYCSPGGAGDGAALASLSFLGLFAGRRSDVQASSSQRSPLPSLECPQSGLLKPGRNEPSSCLVWAAVLITALLHPGAASPTSVSGGTGPPIHMEALD
ncbi:hypothetical protein SKAU_G00047750 [Synaphobranchus kaupii]|uniref:Uncharacterized protein n=1 Tax=Synaphobranchus kaupii TaxID=118154 RepID=A0A9Q1G3Q5_SYNKA|nr:hypothetical protein SKAU_G00047750 [Synaphobranchus kaupii]